MGGNHADESERTGGKGWKDAEETTPGERDAWGLPIWGEQSARHMVLDAGFTDVSITYVDWGGANARLVIAKKD